MAGYMRMISYLNIYRDGKKMNNCGFAKVDSRNNLLRLYVTIRMPGTRGAAYCDIYMIVRLNERIVGIPAGKMKVASGKGYYAGSLRADDIGGTGYGIEDMCGMYIVLSGDEAENEIIASEWDDKPIVPELFETYQEMQTRLSEQEEIAPETEEVEEEDAPAQMEIEESNPEFHYYPGNSDKGYENYHHEQHMGFWKELEKRCVKMRPFAGFKECIKMKPNDIVCLPKKYWKLGQNSFLLHGYYHYRYLVAARYVEDEKEKYMLGVPGKNEKNDKLMANMFGFTRYVENTGDKENGYWCMNLD